MKFCKAVEKLKSGSKITRYSLKDGVYFVMEGEDVKSYRPRLQTYVYNEEIMISEGWIVDNGKEERKFCDIIPFLIKGSKAHLKDWKEMFIFFDNASKDLVLRSMDNFTFIPDFESFIAEDWMEIP